MNIEINEINREVIAFRNIHDEFTENTTRNPRKDYVIHFKT